MYVCIDVSMIAYRVGSLVLQVDELLYFEELADPEVEEAHGGDEVVTFCPDEPHGLNTLQNSVDGGIRKAVALGIKVVRWKVGAFCWR